MLKEIIEKLQNEILCPKAQAIGKKVSKILNSSKFATLSRGRDSFTVSSDTVMAGFIAAKDSNGKHIELDLCDDDYKVA